MVLHRPVELAALIGDWITAHQADIVVFLPTGE